ncbi:MAG: neutral zinc metallopeptidase [Chloroflexota bacterium]|nr:neutral zinc metallopeptidase [Chloroflexota bacterium]
MTDQAYPTAAEVTYTQPYVDAAGQQQVLETQMYLAPFEGEWRWFFGADRAYIAEVLGRFAPPPPPASAPDIDSLLQAVTNDLDQFYRGALASTEYDYQTPRVTVVDEGQYAESACGPAQTGFWAFYCPVDQTVYLDRPFLRDLSERYGQFAASFVVGHEWAHHVETVTGLRREESPDQVGEVYSIELELLADCYTGVWAQDADTRELLSLEEVANGVSFIYQRLGDPEGIEPFDPRAHGSANARTNAFSDGYDDGFLGCELVA